MEHNRLLTMLVGLLILLVSGCGAGQIDDAVAAIDGDQAASMTIGELLRSTEQFSRFRDLAERTEATVGGNPTTWLEIWDTKVVGDHGQGVTVFVPTDAAFEFLDPEVLQVLDDPTVDNQLLRTLLGAHYVHRPYPTADFEPGPHPAFRGGATVELSTEPWAWGGHEIELADLRVANGYVHVIAGVVVPEGWGTAVEG